MDPEFLDVEAEHEHDQRVTSISSRFDGSLNINKLNRWIGEMIDNKGTDLFRYKGILSVKGMDHKFVYQGVHMLFGGAYSQELMWDKDEKRECTFVFIGRDLNHKELEDGFMKCKAEDLRFKKNDIIYANVDGFKKGKILECWDEGNPYRVEIQDDEKKNVWVPIDDDEYVRKKFKTN